MRSDDVCRLVSLALEATNTAWVGTCTSELDVKSIFLVEYAWKMFSLRYFRIEIDTSTSLSDLFAQWSFYFVQDPLGETTETTSSVSVPFKSAHRK
jgi:hypothetical protein